MSVTRAVLLSLLFGGCALVPRPDAADPAVPAPAVVAPRPASETATPVAPVPSESSALPAPTKQTAPPVSFAAPPVLLEGSGARIAPADMPVPGYHCHLISPGKRYCHGGMD